MEAETRDPLSGDLTLTGTDGLLRFDRFDLRPGQSVVVGRSRKCDFSLRRSKTFLTAAEAEQRRILADRAFLKVSRRHVRISYLAPNHVEIWNLSKNGTFVNDRRVDRILLRSIPDEGVRIRLAETETLVLRPAPKPVHT